jgi:glycosyltransferase involved in cell wall biosynthesis
VWNPARRVSAIVPCRNGAAFLPDCLGSLLGQSGGWVPGEIVVVDDGSTDSSSDVVRHFQKRSRRIRHYRIEAGNANRARIMGLSMSRGPYVLLLDADNWLDADFVEKTFRALTDPARDPRIAFAYGDRIMHYESDWHPDRPGDGSRVVRCPVGGYNPDRLRGGNYIDMCALIERSAVQLDPGLGSLQDWDLWLRLLEQNRAGVYVPDAAFHYRVHDRNLTRRRVEESQRKDFDTIVRRYHLQPWLDAAQAGFSKPPKVSVVVIAKTEAEVNEKIDSLQRQRYPDVEFCASTAPGFARAYQEAVDKATGDIIVFTETDCAPVSESWLAELVAEVRPNRIVHGLTVTDLTPNMSNTAGPAELIKKHRFDPSYEVAEDSEWFLRLKSSGVEYAQLNTATVIHYRPYIPHRMKQRAYAYGRHWARLSRSHADYVLPDIVRKYEMEREIASDILRGIRDEGDPDAPPAGA